METTEKSPFSRTVTKTCPVAHATVITSYYSPPSSESHASIILHPLSPTQQFHFDSWPTGERGWLANDEDCKWKPLWTDLRYVAKCTPELMKCGCKKVAARGASV